MLAGVTGCTEIRGRRMLQEGNALFKEGRYAEAVERFTQAEALVPNLPVLWLNKGYTCRQIVIPGSKAPESRKAADCAIAAFKRLAQLDPGDDRADALLTQTLFDAEDYDVLSAMFLERHRKAPTEVGAIYTLQRIYSSWGKLDEALEWYEKAAEVKPNDPEAQYAIGVFVWNQLFKKGGGAAMTTFDPRPKPAPEPPAAGYGDIVAQRRVDLADLGIKHLQRAIEMRPKYTDAMTYLNLLYRQKSFAYFSEPDIWQQNVDQANEWQKKTLEILSAGKQQAAATTAGASPPKKAPN